MPTCQYIFIFSFFRVTLIPYMSSYNPCLTSPPVVAARSASLRPYSARPRSCVAALLRHHLILPTLKILCIGLTVSRTSAAARLTGLRPCSTLPPSTVDALTPTCEARWVARRSTCKRSSTRDCKCRVVKDQDGRVEEVE